MIMYAIVHFSLYGNPRRGKIGLGQLPFLVAVRCRDQLARSATPPRIEEVACHTGY
jgi:hypothetical protein